MRIGDENLDYEYHVAFYERLGLLIGDPEKDDHWYCEAKEKHAQTVSYAVREVFINAVEFSQKFNGTEAEIQLKFGVGRRTKFIWLSLQRLISLIPLDRNEPLPNVDVDEVERDLNVIYINIRGTLDNLAWCLVDLFGDEKTRDLPPIKVNLFDRSFLDRMSLCEVAEFVKDFDEWNNNLSKLRDPAAHRIPLTVPPAVLDEAAEKEYALLWANHQKALNEAEF